MRHALALAVFALAGCKAGGSSDTTATGQTAYHDASTDHDGNPTSPQRPAPQPNNSPMRVLITVSGNGTLSGLDASCLDPTGDFDGLFDGDGKIDNQGGYTSGFAESDAAFTVPSGDCVIPSVSVDALTDVKVRAELQNTQQNCDDHCSASARADAEDQCGSDASQASCRTDAETSAKASCEQQCSGSSTTRIVAETELSVSDLATLNAGALGVTGLGTIHADLTFDHFDDAQ